MKQYFRRMLKSLTASIILIGVLLLMVPIITEHRAFNEVFAELISTGRYTLLVALLLIFSFSYPILGFGKKVRYINGSFVKNRQEIEMAFDDLNYLLESEEENTLVFRKKNILLRFIYYWEDKIEVDTKNNPLIISGVRKELRKLDQLLDKHLLSKE
ncbi:MAG: hypothetical protein JXJ22_18250 [Bacteroidales bacterium]|nr:hypothetical protein [Bacteroidales bacterium]